MGSHSNNIVEISLKNSHLDACTEAMLSHMTSVQALDLSCNDLKEVNFANSKLSALKILNLEENKLVGLIFSDKQSEQLAVLRVTHNQLVDFQLDTLSHLKALQVLDLRHNNIQGNINVSTFSTLKKLRLGDNKLGKLPADRASLASLREFAAPRNELCEIDLSVLPPTLQTLVISGNKLSILHFGTQLAQLTKLDIQNNRPGIVDLQLQGLPSLTILLAKTNLLEKLDLSGLASLHTLDLRENSLRSLDLSGTRALAALLLGPQRISPNVCISGITESRRAALLGDQAATSDVHVNVSLRKDEHFRLRMSHTLKLLRALLFPPLEPLLSVECGSSSTPDESSPTNNEQRQSSFSLPTIGELMVSVHHQQQRFSTSTDHLLQKDSKTKGGELLSLGNFIALECLELERKRYAFDNGDAATVMTASDDNAYKKVVCGIVCSIFGHPSNVLAKVCKIRLERCKPSERNFLKKEYDRFVSGVPIAEDVVLPEVWP